MKEKNTNIKNVTQYRENINEYIKSIGKSKSENIGAQIDLKNLSKKYEGNADYTLENINLTINSGEFCVFLGPSGCGKTTLLRMIAGLNSITRGDLLFDGKKFNNLSPSERDVAMVFQSYALYPHMNVYKNMSFGLRLAKERKDIIDKRVKDAAKILQIDSHLYNKPSDLSGGQRQRVAIGRAIVRKPSLFLMDEPLSNLDAKLRETMRREIVEIHRMLNTTSIYVTHDQLEAMTMADKIVVFHNGKIQQAGSPKELYFKPANLFVASFIGSPTMNFFTGKVKGKQVISDEITEKIKIPAAISSKLKDGEEITLGYRTENVAISSSKKAGWSEAKIQNIEVLGKEQLIIIKFGESTAIATVGNSEEFKYDQKIYFKLNSDHIHMFNKKTGKRIN